MHEIVNQIINFLKSENSDFEIYTSFDSIPVMKKSGNLFVVVSVKRVTLNSAFPDGHQGMALFTADFRISVLAPMTTSGERMLEFFYTVIMPRMHSAGCMPYEMQADAPEIDLKLQKLVYSGLFHLHGIYIPDSDSNPDPEVEV